SYPTADARAFTKIGIPSLTLTTIGGNRYPHVPSDIPENVDRALITKAANLLFNTIIELANGDYQGRSEESRYFMKP
ncbi:MAG: M28 family peptidase, partial [Bacteroidales bacterium]|nr:M28 family peptidase [Candidatus Colimorpha onthohippi]